MSKIPAHTLSEISNSLRKQATKTVDFIDDLKYYGFSDKEALEYISVAAGALELAGLKIRDMAKDLA